MGLADVLVPQDQVRAAALIVRRRDRRKLAARPDRDARHHARRSCRPRAQATEHELAEQTRLRKTEDFKEGVKAMAERRLPMFNSR